MHHVRALRTVARRGDDRRDPGALRLGGHVTVASLVLGCAAFALPVHPAGSSTDARPSPDGVVRAPVALTPGGAIDPTPRPADPVDPSATPTASPSPLATPAPTSAQAVDGATSPVVTPAPAVVVEPPEATRKPHPSHPPHPTHPPHPSHASRP